MIAALYVQKGGCYAGLPGVELWDIDRDARKYDGPWSVVAHPPCHLWTKFARVNFSRWGGEHNRPGNDTGCFEAALASVRKWGGILEHPAQSYAWGHFKLLKPKPRTWSFYDGYYVCEVWQSAYGHFAGKATWLLYCGLYAPPPLRWERPEGVFQIGGADQRGKAANKPTISGKKASATPPDFRDLLISIAASASLRKAA